MIILILGVGSVAIAYASNTTITNTSVSTTTVNTSDLVASHDVNVTNAVNTKDLTITGSCTGCPTGSGNPLLHGMMELYHTNSTTYTINQVYPNENTFEEWRIDYNNSIQQSIGNIFITQRGTLNTALISHTSYFGLEYNTSDPPDPNQWRDICYPCDLGVSGTVTDEDEHSLITNDQEIGSNGTHVYLRIAGSVQDAGQSFTVKDYKLDAQFIFADNATLTRLQ